MLADFSTPRHSNDMKIAVQKTHLVGQILYTSLVPSKKRHKCEILVSERLTPFFGGRIFCTVWRPGFFIFKTIKCFKSDKEHLFKEVFWEFNLFEIAGHFFGVCKCFPKK